MNNYGVRKTICTQCVHQEVCSKKEIFLKAQEFASNLYITGEGENENREIQKLSDIDWIKPIELECNFYMVGKPVQRGM